MWGMRCALDTGVARTLGLTSDELDARLQRGSLAQVAAERGVPMARLRRVARTIAEPQLAAAVAAGVIKDAERTALFRRLESKTGPWSDLATSPSARGRRHARRSSSSSSSSSSRRAQVLGASEAGKVSSSSSSSFSSSSSRGGVESAVTRTSHRTS
jgi:hypothetical protein